MVEVLGAHVVQPFLSGSAPIPEQVHISHFFELIDLDFQRQGKKFRKLFPHQQKAFPKALKGLSLVIRDDPGNGKTYSALACITKGLSQRLICVYLVPTKRLAYQKQKKLQEFYTLRTSLGIEYSLAHVVTISGEQRPSKAELMKFREKLIIVATYEAFRAFSFEIQNREYFPNRKCFGTVVIDESHMIGDRSRGMRLHTLIQKLKEEHDPQFCLLTATFAREDAEWWSAQLGADLIFEKPEQTYPVDLRGINLQQVSRLKTACEIIHEQVVESEERIAHYEEESDQAEAQLSELEELNTQPKYTYTPKKILVFCSTRWLAVDMVQALWEQPWCGENNPACWCELIHAGLREEEQQGVFDIFKDNKKAGVRILISSPLLEAGIDVEEIDLVLIVDPEMYTATRLNQMCGRLIRGGLVTGKVSLIVAEQFEEVLYQKIRLSADHKQILGFNLRNLFEEFPEVDLSHLILEQLSWHQLTTPELHKHLQLLFQHPNYKTQDSNNLSPTKNFVTQVAALMHKGPLKEQGYTLKQIILSQIFWLEHPAKVLLDELPLLGSPESDLEVPTFTEFLESLVPSMNLENLSSELTPIILNQLFIQNRPARELYAQVYKMEGLKGEVRTQIVEVIRALDVKGFIKELVQSQDLFAQLEMLVEHELVRRVEGAYALTFMGDAVVETGLATDVALEGLKFIRKNLARPYEPAAWLAHRYSLLLTRMITQQAVIDIADPTQRRRRRNAILRFMFRYDANMPAWNNMWRYESIGSKRSWALVHPGDEENLRRTGIWISTSILALYESYLRHLAPPKSGCRSYYARCPKKELSAKERLLYRQIYKEIKRFQPKGSPRRGRKADLRSRRCFYPHARFTSLLELTLESFGAAGATISEIKSKLEEARKVAVSLFPFFFPFLSSSPPIPKDSTIYSTLNENLEPYIFKELEYMGQSHRPPYRYWLKKFKRRPTPKKWCKNCKFFRSKKQFLGKQGGDRTHCKLGWKCGSPYGYCDPPCPDFQHHRKEFLIYFPQHFQAVGEGKVRCPYCHGYDTALRPTLRTMTICRRCKILLKRVRKGRYHGRTDVPMRAPLLERVEDWRPGGKPYISLYRFPRPITLRMGETLEVRDPEETGIPLVQIRGPELPKFPQTRRDILFLDEISSIHLRGGRITSGQQFFEKYGIEVQESVIFEEEMVAEIKKEAREIELREALQELEDDVVLLKAGEAVIARILSNISYTYTLGEVQPARKLTLVFTMFDHIVQVLILLNEVLTDTNPLEYMNHLRGLEGAADQNAWELIVKSLPKQYRFDSRKVRRGVRTALHPGAKAWDPFNCALNYLYRLLRDAVKEAFERAGFHRDFPGLGFLHRRHRPTPIIEHPNNEALIYDFIDPYRPPIRFYLALAFHRQKAELKPLFTNSNTQLASWCLDEQQTITMMDFKSPPDKWSPIYTISENGRIRLKYLFELIGRQSFSYQGQQLALRSIIQKEAEDFAHFLMRKKAAPKTTRSPHIVSLLLAFTFQWLLKPTHQSFSFSCNTDIADFYQQIRWMLNPVQRKPIFHKDLRMVELETAAFLITFILLPYFFQSKKLPLLTLASRTFENIIILTHADADGFHSALQLLRKYYIWNDPIRGKVRIFKVSQEGTANFLDETIPKLLWHTRDAHNTVIVADLEIPSDRIFLRNLRHKYLRVLKGRAERLEVIWYDHHPRDASIPLEIYREQYGIEFHHDLSMETHQIIARDLSKEYAQELARYSQFFENPVAQMGLVLIGLFLRLLQITQYQKETYRKQKFRRFEEAQMCKIGALSVRIFHIARSTHPFHLKRDWKDLREDTTARSQWTNLVKWMSFQDQLNQALPHRFLNALETDPEKAASLQPWIQAFIALQQRDWFQFFESILLNKPPPKIPLMTDILKKLPKDVFYFAGTCATENHELVGTLIPWEPIPIGIVHQYIQRTLGSFPPILAIWWILDGSVSIRIRKGVPFNYGAFKTAQGGVGHPRAFRIFQPRQAAYRVGTEALFRPFSLRSLMAQICTTKFWDVLPADLPEIPMNAPLPWDPSLDLHKYLEGGAVWKRPTLGKPAKARRLVLYGTEGASIDIPEGMVTLLFSSVKSRNYETLNQFLYQILAAYMIQNPAKNGDDNKEILFLEPNTPRGHFHSNLLCQIGISSSLISKSLLYLPDLDYPTLHQFILKYLLSTIQTRGIRLVILSLPFRLIQKHFGTSDRLSVIMSEKGSLLAAMLRYIAELGKVRIIITSNATRKDTTDPLLHRNTQANLRFWIHVSQVNNGTVLTIRDRRENDDRKFDLIVPDPPARSAAEILKNACDILPGISWFPSRLKDDTSTDLFVPAPETQEDWDEWEEWAHKEEEVAEFTGEEYSDIEIPELITTIYGENILVWRIHREAGYIQDIDTLLATDPRERMFDLIYWANKHYSIRNSTVDLHVLIGPKTPFKGHLTRDGHGAFFKGTEEGGLEFPIFERILPFYFLEPTQLHTYLQQLRTKFFSLNDSSNDNTTSKILSDSNLEEICNAFLSVFSPFPPARLFQIQEYWAHALETMQTYFSCDQIVQLTDKMLQQLAQFKDFKDPFVVRNTIRSTFFQGFKETRREHVEPVYTSLPNEAHYLAKYPQLRSIEYADHPHIPNFRFLVFTFQGWIDWSNELPLLRASVDFPRQLDICYFVNEQYHLYSNIGTDWVDLSSLEAFGAKTLGGATDVVKFDPHGVSSARIFTSFMQDFYDLLFLDFRQFLDILVAEKERYGKDQGQAQVGNISAFNETVIKSLYDTIFKIIKPFPPVNPLQSIGKWSDVLHKLQEFFSWPQVDNITYIFLDWLRTLKDYSDEDMIRSAIEDGLNQGNYYKCHIN